MGLYRLKRGVLYHQGQRIAANSKTGANVVELRDDHPMLKQTERWERVGAGGRGERGAGAGAGGATGAPQFLPASGPTQDPSTPAHNPSEVLTSETVRGGAIPGVTEPLVGQTDSENAAYDPTAAPERDAVANSSLSSPQRDWYTYTIPQAVHHVRAAQDLTTLAQYKNLELAPKLGKQRGKVLEAIDERAGELKQESKQEQK